MPAMTEKRVVGIPAPRVEGEQKVTGRPVDALDAVLPGMLGVKMLRSPFARARIKKIDAARPRALEGVRAVLTGKDLAGAKIGKKIVDMPILAADVVRFAGEKVAAVARGSEEVAAGARGLVEKDYEGLPGGFGWRERRRRAGAARHPRHPHYAGP